MPLHSCLGSLTSSMSFLSVPNALNSTSELSTWARLRPSERGVPATTTSSRQDRTD